MRCLLVLLGCGMVWIAAASYGQEEEAAKKRDTERIVVPADGVTEFTVTGRSTLFRVSVSTPTGGTISAKPKITGNARHVRTAEIIRVTEGGKPIIGSLEKEFVFRGTGAGTATIEIEKTSPSEPTPVVVTYKVTID